MSENNPSSRNSTSSRYAIFSRWAVIVLLLLTISGSIAWTLSTPRAFDDYIYSTAFSGVHEHYVLDSLGADVVDFPLAVESAVNHYKAENGRLANITHILWQPFGHDAEALFLGVMMGLMFMLTALWARGWRSWPRLSVTILAVVLTWCVYPWYDFMQSLDFQTNYVLPTVFSLLFLYIFRGEEIPRGWRMWLLITLGFLTGWYHEGFGIALVAWLFFYAMLAPGRLRARNLYFIMAALLVGLTVGICGSTWLRLIEADSSDAERPSQFVFARRLILQLWPLYLALIAAALRWRIAGYGRAVISDLAMLGSAVTVVVMSWVLQLAERVLWPMDMMCTLIILSYVDSRLVCRFRAWAKILITLCFIVGYSYWLTLLVSYERRVSADVAEVERQLSPRSAAGAMVASLDYLKADDVQVYLLGIPQPVLENDWNITCMGAYFRKGRNGVMIVPPGVENQPFDSWPKIPGSAGTLRGEWPMIASCDSTLTGLTVTFGRPELHRMSPVNILYLILSQRTVTSPTTAEAQLAKPHRIVLADGDTIWRYIPLLPHYLHNRRFVGVEKIAPETTE